MYSQWGGNTQGPDDPRWPWPGHGLCAAMARLRSVSVLRRDFISSCTRSSKAWAASLSPPWPSSSCGIWGEDPKMLGRKMGEIPWFDNQEPRIFLDHTGDCVCQIGSVPKWGRPKKKAILTVKMMNHIGSLGYPILQDKSIWGWKQGKNKSGYNQHKARTTLGMKTT